ncbi:Cu2+-exporting ATPase [Mycoplasma testudineum]|uniref:Cu2+-exporting ATPase n=1 Tax=Mycoplasma testudineum TaxID=244584 RepID=A0A4R6ID05_9MOLU|nr:heavy-metal-associated domain-containing protein [Mycoplasma testudineum]OYD26646.1 hypothetical protein CG473_02485 [Mycoplasma testudineum]TDO19774.1 Cu2+-exporting ATPase [Mycoplasma testudineum]
MEIIKLKIDDMHCTSCVFSIEKILAKFVKESGLKFTPNVAKKSLKIEYDKSKVSKETILEAFTNNGLPYEEI